MTTQGDPEPAHELAEIFAIEFSRLLVAIRHAIDTQDGVGLERASHSLKGVIGYFTDGVATEHATRLQVLARDNNFG